LARDGRLLELRELPDRAFANKAEVKAALAGAAGYGRAEVLAFFEAKGVELSADDLLRAAAATGRREIFQFFIGRGHTAISPNLVDIVLRGDHAAIVRFWIAHQLVEPRDLLADAARFDAFHCFHALASQSNFSDGTTYAALIRAENVPARLEVILGRKRLIQVYNYRTPSALIDVNSVSFLFLLYRRVMRIVLMGRLRR
jgi:hypothetical protein